VDADRLYGLPLERFIAERDRLVRSLRGDGRREEASDVAALRKPSVAAWGVNQAVRGEPEAFEELTGAGDALRAAQEQVLGGADARDELRVAAERERAAADVLAESAAQALRSGGHAPSPSVLERIGETLHAAALDDDARGQVSGGRLVSELRHVGFGLGDGPIAPAQKGIRGAPRGKATSGGSRAAERQEQTQQEARRREREREAERAAARRELRAAERRLRDAERHAARAEERAEQARDVLAQAEQVAEAARAERDDASLAHRAADERRRALEP
jgi:hypothetical protein